MAPVLLQAFAGCLGYRLVEESSKQEGGRLAAPGTLKSDANIASSAAQSCARASLNGSLTGAGGAASIAPPSVRESTAAAFRLPKNEAYFSPLSVNMSKSVNLRSSVNGLHPAMAPDAAAALGGHGTAVVHISRNGPLNSSVAVAASAPSTPLQPCQLALMPAFGSPQPASALQQQSSEAAAARAPLQPLATSPQQTAAMPLASAAHESQAQVHHQEQQAPVPAQLQPQTQPQQQQQRHGRNVSVAEAYAAEDLDDAWLVVLGDLEQMLAARGQPALGAQERAVAIRRLIELTGSRGLQFALETALKDVLRHRNRK
ncbi:hypothetical protein HYH02_002823 [Chlamydomonas schloesseri]|uniref:Uncharacterized protein n=1 Tax=Chlamydomonas schloesseri TaxID=2026947 RepID=A0A836BAE2_9CHLO|nr:hypothetical protein HYH02_002823 [Chlamydomonas schloesseri]|eukprot:KAG2452586.1 hypothetical protein HYH02_002823 [Chlamydomonas schloesseri]